MGNCSTPTYWKPTFGPVFVDSTAKDSFTVPGINLVQGRVEKVPKAHRELFGGLAVHGKGQNSDFRRQKTSSLSFLNPFVLSFCKRAHPTLFKCVINLTLIH